VALRLQFEVKKYHEHLELERKQNNALLHTFQQNHEISKSTLAALVLSSLHFEEFRFPAQVAIKVP
jgi:hypothetical protein